VKPAEQKDAAVAWTAKLGNDDVQVFPDRVPFVPKTRDLLAPPVEALSALDLPLDRGGPFPIRMKCGEKAGAVALIPEPNDRFGSLYVFGGHRPSSISRGSGAR
jgi:hypothetical protein